MEELIIGEKRYVSSKRAAEITGYAKDYVGQLCREGRVEATLVGRAWYVLEDSIRAHRFGEPTVAAIPGAPIEADPEKVPSWNPPVYAPEPVDLVPEVMPKAPEPVATTETALPSSRPEDIQDMRNAWREWFERREEALLETPEIVDAREEAYEAEQEVQEEEEKALDHQEEPEELEAQAVQILRSEERPIGEERVPINRFHEVYAPEPVAAREEVEEPVIRMATQHYVPVQAPRRGSNLILKALFVSVIGLSIVVASIGVGYFDRFMTQNGFQYSVLRVLGGTIVVNKSSK